MKKYYRITFNSIEEARKRLCTYSCAHCPIHLKVINGSIKNCNKFIDENPDDVVAKLMGLEIIESSADERLNDEEIAICKLFEAKWVSRDFNENSCVKLWDIRPKILNNETYITTDTSKVTTKEHLLAQISDKFFPSLKNGYCVKVEN